MRHFLLETNGTLGNPKVPAAMGTIYDGEACFGNNKKTAPESELAKSGACQHSLYSD